MLHGSDDAGYTPGRCPVGTFIPEGLGWHPQLPDPRDYAPRHQEVLGLVDGLKRRGRVPQSVDWRQYVQPPEDRGDLPTSAAHACVALLQYFERRASGRLIEPSRMFVYQTARRLGRASGAGGIDLRSTWKAIARFGVPEERHWPYDLGQADAEPDAFAYAIARRFAGLCYVSLDRGEERSERGEAALPTVKSYLAAGFPSVFGFSVSTAVSEKADIPYPTVFDGIRGGQAAMAVGYDDNHRFRSYRGCILIANSWGCRWGDSGFGWLPYHYLRDRLATDFWTVLKPDWLASGEFRRPR